MKAVLFTAESTGMRLANYKHLFAENGIEFSESLSRNEDEIIALAKDADVVLTVLHGFNERIINALEKCRGIVRPAIGFDIIDVAAATKRGIPVCNIPDYSTEEVAVMAMSLMLSAIRKVSLYNDLLKKGCWKGLGWVTGYPVRRLSVLTLGLMGFGNIARLVAKYAQGFGFNIVAYDPYIPEGVFAECGVRKVEAEELYQVSDVISVHIPLFKETQHMINKESFAKMKNGVIIINTARGPVICEQDLIAALKSGKVKAAGLDVFETEPLSDPDYELLKMDNVIVTPHIGFQSEESFQELQHKAVLTAIKLAQGEIPYNAVNKKDLQR